MEPPQTLYLVAPIPSLSKRWPQWRKLWRMRSTMKERVNFPSTPNASGRELAGTTRNQLGDYLEVARKVLEYTAPSANWLARNEYELPSPLEKILPREFPRTKKLTPTRWRNDILDVPTISLMTGRKLHAGNGASVLYVRSLRAKVEGKGLNRDDTYIMKAFYPPRGDDSSTRPEMSRRQLETELDCYKRISENSKLEHFSLTFIMQLEGYLVNNFVEGMLFEPMHKDLRSFMCRWSLAMDARRLMAQIATGIAVLHSIGIVHRDIKPENVLVDSRGNARITDFGLSFVTKFEMALPVGYHWMGPFADPAKFRQEYVGTPGYMAPEMINSRVTVPEMDYFALGCIFFELLGGKVLFDVAHMEINNWDRAWHQGISEQHTYLCSKLNSLRESYAALNLLCGLLAVDPTRRFNISQMERHLYFSGSEDLSEFKKLEYASCRPKKYISLPEDAFSVKGARYTFHPSDHGSNGWLNPKGAFFTT
ncbi:hypothetical protein NLJ89_g3381 [Agrocybe chaxingu]|uniref:Protein kinase domain-containing protein n=1 Tax=Agrocybe chaxingu TaxID=84603 RepID=A0A9W8MXE1_9AGAR|nr:hypothetical protein NLJ89_g3381 [Agrocybe chaxingu]